MEHVTHNTENKELMLRAMCYVLYLKITIDWLFAKPISWFLLTTFRHKGILDGWQGIVFSFFSALRFPRAYIRYLSQSLRTYAVRKRGHGT